MYKIRKRIEVAGSHCLKLDYESPCKNLHGHNWFVTVEISSKVLDKNGMVMDFKKLKGIIQDKVHDIIDHKNINDVLPFNPTAENMAKWIFEEINSKLDIITHQCTRIEVEESRDNTAIYEGNIV